MGYQPFLIDDPGPDDEPPFDDLMWLALDEEKNEEDLWPIGDQTDPRVGFDMGDTFVVSIVGWEPWAKVRTYWRKRWITLFWKEFALKKHMAPGGRVAKRDREEYEKDFA